MVEKHRRSFAKAVSWRITGTLDTVLIAFLVTGKLRLAISIGFVEVFTKIFLFYLHERLWNKCAFGRKEEQGTVMSGDLANLTDEELTYLDRADDALPTAKHYVRGLVAEVRRHRALLSKIGGMQASMNVETTGLYRFEAPWVFADGEKRLSVAEVIRRQLGVKEIP